MKLRGGVFAVVTLVLFLTPNAAAASTQPGLSVSPVANQLTVSTGTPNSSQITIGNTTDKEMNVQLSVKQFNVAPLSYNFQFRTPVNNWIQLDQTSIMVKPGESKQILYDVLVPKGASPGGSYYAIIASTQIPGSAVSSTIQASSLLYITINGNLVRTSVLRNSSIPHFVTADHVDYKFDVENTGNVYFTAIFFGQLQSIFGGFPENNSTHLLMPGAPRTITGSVASPTWPGIYQITYGYKVDFANIIISQSTYIVYMPPWSFVALVLIILLAIYSWQQRSKHKKKNS
jgi:hypothetical protein